MSIKFSVIVPLYCLDGDIQTLQSGIEALTKQSIGTDNIELIVAGSKDDVLTAERVAAVSGFAGAKFLPADGIAKALCIAFEAMSGELMITYDPRNRWTDTAFAEIYEYVNSAPEWFDVLACRPFPNDRYPLRAFSFVFNRGTRVSNIYLEPTCLFKDLNTTVIKCNAVKNSGYDGAIDYNIDSYIMSLILAEYPKFGVLNKPLITQKHINHDGIKQTHENEDDRLEAIMNYHNAVMALRSAYTARYFNSLIIYDLRSYVVDKDYSCCFSQKGKEQLSRHITKVFEAMPDYLITDAPPLTTVQRWGLYLMKRWTEDSDESVKLQYDLYKSGEPFHYNSGAALNIQQIELKDNTVYLDGMSPAFLTGEAIELFAKTQEGKRYDPESTPFRKLDIYNCFGEIISEGKRLLFKVPINKRTDIRFYLRINGVDNPVKLNFGPDTYLRNNWINTCNYFDDHIITCKSGKVISIRERTPLRVFMTERLISRERKEKGDLKGLKARKRTFKQDRLFYTGHVKKRVAFATARSNTTLMDNMKAVWDRCGEDKIEFTRKMPYSEQDMKEAANTVYRSKVIVTDDYFYPLRRYGKRNDQYAVQIWHAPGAFKKFGIDAGSMFPGTDLKYHRDYDLVTTSSEYVRQIYADAFGIDVEKVRALGVPRTDIWFDNEYLESRRNYVYEKYPDLKGKQVILYAPTFREPANKERVYLPEIDFGKIDDGLRDDQIMILCPHPIMPEYEGEWNYRKVKMVRDVSTNDFMLVADLLVTDYSSVIFEYSLLNKPMAFLCYDYDEYDRDFYLDYESELPGEIFKDLDPFLEYLRNGEYTCSTMLDEFREKYMSACDGNSSKRVADAIAELLNK